MRKYSTPLLLALFACIFFGCKRSNESPNQPLFAATIDGALWKADSVKVTQGDPLGNNMDIFVIVGSDKYGKAFFLNKISLASTSVDFVVTSVVFKYFQGYRDFTKGNIVNLSWATGKENETEKFVIERSFDAINFAVAGEVAAKGNSDETTEYLWSEKPPLNEAFGSLYYRLKIVDKDQKITYSTILFFRASTPALYIYNDTYSYGTNGSISITKNDEEKRIISGTFYFNGIDDATGRIIKIENGKFENLPY